MRLREDSSTQRRGDYVEYSLQEEFVTPGSSWGMLVRNLRLAGGTPALIYAGGKPVLCRLNWG